MPFWDDDTVWQALWRAPQFSGWGRRPRPGKDSAGKDSAGKDSAGKDSAGKDSAGKDSAGKDSAGAAGDADWTTRRRAFWRGLIAARAGLLPDATGASPYRAGPLARLLEPRRLFVDRDGDLTPRLKGALTTGVDLDAAQKTLGDYGVHSLHRPYREATEEELNAAQTDTAERMEDKTPQYFLRNIGRVERPADDILEFTYQRPDRAKMDDPAIQALAATIRQRYQLHADAPLATALLYRHARAHRHLIAREPWDRLFGHHISSNLDGPVWKYFPDDDAFARYGEPHSERVEVSEADRQ